MSGQIPLKSEREISIMKDGGEILSNILTHLGEMIVEGISTMDLELEAQKLCKKMKVTPAFLGYHGFPAVLCVSVNDEIIHGIPSRKKILKSGDLVSIDMGVIYKGYFSDSARTFPVGETSQENYRLLECTKQALDEGISHMVSGGSLFQISSAISKIAIEAGLGIVQDYSGHGIGKSLHENPPIFNYIPSGHSDIELKVGMVFAIEPMFTLGSPRTYVASDNWTVLTKDKSFSAHFEHTVAITNDGFKILTN